MKRGSVQEVNTKLLSTYPASQSYIDAQGPGFIG
jgi:hypothetical protein